MTISSSLNAGVSGLSANASKLASISDNIANSGTRGYKRVQTDFHSMVMTSSGSGTYSAGGVRASTVRMIDERGPLVSTNNATDLAVRGRGMLPVASITDVEAGNGDPTMMLTTTGSFRTNEDGLLTTSSGLVLLGWPAAADGTLPEGPRDSTDELEAVRLNTNKLSGEPTTEITVGLNLPSTGTEAGASGDTEEQVIEYFDNLGRSESLTVTFTPTVPVAPAPASNEWTMTITDSATGATAIGDYTLTFDDSRTGGGTLSAVATTTGGAYDATTGSIIVNVAGGPMEINIGMFGDDNGLTQLGDRFAPAEISKDGSPVGNYTGVEIDESGYVRAKYDSGASQVVYKIPLVDLPNPNGMVAMDQQTYLPSSESGNYFLWDAGDGPTGEIISYAQEESAVDVANELTNMIQTQRAYSSNAKVIQTVDEMLQETTNIKR